VGYNMVVTTIAFDSEAESPKLTFKPIGFLDDAAFAEVQEVVAGDTVTNILGASVVASLESAEAPRTAADDADEDGVIPEPVKPAAKATPKAAPKSKVVTDEEVEDAVEAAAPAPKAKAAPKVAPKPAPVAEDDGDLELDGIEFDD
jgi:outer membrane biosynthesis protein TonB